MSDFIERTDLAQQAFDGNYERAQLEAFGATPPQTADQFLYGSRMKFYTTVQQQIEASEDYPVDPIWQEDYMLERIDELALREPPVITESEAVAIFANWITRRRPDTAILRVPPKPRGYGRGYHNE